MNITTKQITPEYWLVTLTITDEGKMPNSRDFVVTVEQLAFLNVWTDLQEKREAKVRLEEAKWWHTQVAIVAVAGGDDGHEIQVETRNRIVELERAAGEETK